MSDPKIDRRTLLSTGLVGAAGLALPRCGGVPALPASTWAWSGGVDASSATVVVKTAVPANRLRVGLSKDLSDAILVDATETTGIVQRFQIDGLDANTRYYYGLETGDELSASSTFKTFPVAAHDLRLAFGGCADTGSNHPVFDAVRRADPDLFLVNGDLHYEDIKVNDPERFRAAYDRVFGATRRDALHRSVATAYIWDDHDFGPNDSDASALGRQAAQAVYREYVPHYALRNRRGIEQAFSYGRVRIIMTDCRSYRDPRAQTMLGSAQRDWLIKELSSAHEDHALVIWVSSVGWITDEANKDSWGGYQAERESIANAIEDRGLNRILMLGGDAHMLAIDDGSHSGFGRMQRGFPVFHASPFDRSASIKGGPYSQGVVKKRGQFGIVEVKDDGGSRIAVSLSGRDELGDEVLSYDFKLDVPELLEL